MNFFESLEARALLAVDVVISEFMAANDSILIDVFGESSDWIEIQNRGDEAANLEGWKFEYSKGRFGDSQVEWAFPEVDLEADAFLIVMASGMNVVVAEPTYEIHTNFRLRREGGILALVAPDGEKSTVEYSAQSTDVSFGFVGASREYFGEPTPGAENIINFDLAISEFMTNNETTLVDSFGETPDWIEIHNLKDEPVNLSGWKIKTDRLRWRFPEVILEAHGFLVVFASGRDEVVREPRLEIHSDFSLARRRASMQLISPDGFATSEINYPPQVDDESYGFLSDRSQLVYFVEPTPGAENPNVVDSEIPDLVISEFMADNETTLQDVFGEPSDWIEIHNREDHAVNLRGWKLKRNLSTVWSFPKLIVKPRGFLVVFASGRDEVVLEPSIELHTNFQLSSNRGAVSLSLLTPTGSTKSSISYPRQPADVSFGTSNGIEQFLIEPTPGAENSSIVFAGDANFDGIFDSSDLVLVFQEGYYEAERRSNLSWTDGDWNHDGHFNSKDLVLAFQTGKYTTSAVGVHISPEVVDKRFCVCFQRTTKNNVRLDFVADISWRRFEP